MTTLLPYLCLVLDVVPSGARVADHVHHRRHHRLGRADHDVAAAASGAAALGRRLVARPASKASRRRGVVPPPSHQHGAAAWSCVCGCNGAQCTCNGACRGMRGPRRMLGEEPKLARRLRAKHYVPYDAVCNTSAVQAASKQMQRSGWHAVPERHQTEDGNVDQVAYVMDSPITHDLSRSNRWPFLLAPIFPRWKWEGHEEGWTRLYFR